MGYEVTPEYVVDQGMYYSATAPNFYGYYCTGLEPPGDSEDHRRVFGLDGQDIHHLGMQTENFPYAYYMPNYDFAHTPGSPYNSCDPCLPGAVLGVDNQFVGMQQYFTDAAYQQPVSSSAFVPVVVQPGANLIASVSREPFVFNPVVSGPGLDAFSMKISPPASEGITSSMTVAFGSPLLQIPPNQLPPSSNVPKRFQVDSMHIKQRALDGAVACRGVPLITHARDSAGSVRASDQFKETVHSVFTPLKVTAPAYNSSSDLASNVFARAAVDMVRPKLQSGVVNNGDGSPSILVEQNRGPRTERTKGSLTSLVVKAYTSRAGACNAQGNITIYPDRYNREDFPVNYPDAKFFVIKSYSEDDVHKSIKYSVWSSTRSGNKRLDSAYEDAQIISGGNTWKCPVFLFFSVNGSGQFCGVAEMIGPVDFNRDMDFWQQDKWTGSFHVKWHVIKDVLNASFRHIILENNENRPVTNSRDTQEVKYMPGLCMLNIFKNSPLRTSILDDFVLYEERQRIVFEQKARSFGYGHNLFLPAFSPKKSTVTIKHPLKAQEKPSEQEDTVKCLDSAVSTDNKIISKLDHTRKMNEKKPAVPEATQDAGSLYSVMKIASLSVDSRESEADQSGTSTATVETVQYVTVGSMLIKVDGCGGSA